MSHPPLFDSHLHLTSVRFAEDRQAVLDRAVASGVGNLVTIASNPSDAREAIALARVTPGLWATAGLHPHEAESFSSSVMEQVKELASDPQVVAIGETGLDFFYDNAPRKIQHENLRAHMDLAAQTELPIVMHSRDAKTDTAAVVREYEGSVTGVLHCFSGGRELWERALAAGWFVSFSGLVTFVSELEDFARGTPDDRLLIETDAPYLAPVPKRGRRNEPSYIRHTCTRLAEIRGISFADLAAMTADNARTFYGVREGPRLATAPAA